MPESLDSDAVEQIKESDETWIIDFWADWCGPCKQYSPIFEDVAEDLEDLNFGKVDMEEQQELGTSMGVRALPTTIIMKGESEVSRKSGAMSEQELRDFIEENV